MNKLLFSVFMNVSHHAINTDSSIVKFFSFGFILLYSKLFFAQNLVPNPSFEEYSECPSAISQIERAAFWKAWSNTPDYFNACSPSDNTANGYIDIPANGFGYQLPATGNAYAGINICAYLNGSNFRETIACSLLEPMLIGQTYYVSYKVNLSIGGYYDYAWACNNLGVLFTMEDYDWLENPYVPNNFAHLNESSIITDTLNWISISGTIVADIPYTFIAIGNFYTDEFTDTIHYADVSSLGAYYFIDDVCVSLDPNCGIVGLEPTFFENLDVYPNPSDNVLQISSDYDGCQIKIFAIDGQLVYSETVMAQVLIDTSGMHSGVYIVEISNEQGYRREKLVISHAGG